MNRALRVVARRAVAAVPTFLFVALAAFALLELAPGDAADAYLAVTGGDQGYAAELRRAFGLAASWPERLAGFLGNLLVFDLGRSVVFNRPVAAVVLERLPNTLMLMAATLLVAAGLGTLLGVLAGARPGGLRDRIVSTTALGLLAMPNFWLSLLLILVFVVHAGWFPIGGIRTIGGPGGALDVLHHLVLPAIALGAGYIALYLRTLRAGMVEAWRGDHVRASQARGMRRRVIVWRDVARPALLPVVVLLGQHMGTLVGGSVVVETVFAIPGMGRLAYEAVVGRDALVLVAVLLVATIVVMLANLAVDLLLVRLDPRIASADD
ncbi:MAG: ABC transporter permease [Alphaproteobacteria bacterium]|nr:ABC transporter permease [Alphaproteobacteria bacterium]